MNASRFKSGLQTCALKQSPHLVVAESRLAPQRDELPRKGIVEKTKDYTPGSVSNRNLGRNLNGRDYDSSKLHV